MACGTPQSPRGGVASSTVWPEATTSARVATLTRQTSMKSGSGGGRLNGAAPRLIARLTRQLRLNGLPGMTIGAGVGIGGGLGGSRGLKFDLQDLVESGKAGRKFSAETATKVLILYKTTGGGHKASAQALKQAFEENYGKKVDVEIVDVLPLCAPPFNKSDMYYDFMVKHPFLWRGAFAWSSTRWGERVGFAWYKVGLVDNLKKLFRNARPDLVVSVHPLLQVPTLAALKDIREKEHEPKKIPFATVVTDYTTCHATWFDKGVDKCFVPTVETKEFGERRGLSESQLVMHGLPIRPAFSKLHSLSKTRLRQRLGLKRNLNTVLIVGGGDGMGPVEETCAALDKRFPEMGGGQVVVICGRNKHLVNRLKRRKWESNVEILGFVSNMHEWMAASDCIVTKAGPGTIAESLACGLPIMLNNFIPCQEAGNIPWVIDNKVGDYSNEPDQVASTVLRWFEDKEGLRKMRKRTLALGRPEATYKIVDDLVDLVRKYKWTPFKAGDINAELDKFATVPF